MKKHILLLFFIGSLQLHIVQLNAMSQDGDTGEGTLGFTSGQPRHITAAERHEQIVARLQEIEADIHILEDTVTSEAKNNRQYYDWLVNYIAQTSGGTNLYVQHVYLDLKRSVETTARRTTMCMFIALFIAGLPLMAAYLWNNLEICH